MPVYLIKDGVLIGKADKKHLDSLDPSYIQFESKLKDDISKLVWNGNEVVRRDEAIPSMVTFFSTAQPATESPRIDYERAFMMADNDKKVVAALLRVLYERFNGVSEALTVAEDKLILAMDDKKTKKSEAGTVVGVPVLPDGTLPEVPLVPVKPPKVK